MKKKMMDGQIWIKNGEELDGLASDVNGDNYLKWGKFVVIVVVRRNQWK